MGSPADDALNRLDERRVRYNEPLYRSDIAAVRDELQRLRDDNGRLAVEAATADRDWKAAEARISDLESDLHHNIEARKAAEAEVRRLREELARAETRLRGTNKSRHQWRERAISAEQQLALHGPSNELQRLREEREDTAGIAGLINRMKQAERRASRNVSAAETYKQRAEAAEAEVRRLTEGLREIIANPMLHQIPGVNPDGSVSATYTMAQSIARALLANSPPDGGGAK